MIPLGTDGSPPCPDVDPSSNHGQKSNTFEEFESIYSYLKNK